VPLELVSVTCVGLLVSGGVVFTLPEKQPLESVVTLVCPSWEPLESVKLSVVVSFGTGLPCVSEMQNDIAT
jgi:hypothetical protein